jgi:hypothetical protein
MKARFDAILAGNAPPVVAPPAGESWEPGGGASSN